MDKQVIVSNDSFHPVDMGEQIVVDNSSFVETEQDYILYKGKRYSSFRELYLEATKEK